VNLESRLWPKHHQRIQIVFNDGNHQLKEIDKKLIREAAEQFVLDLIAGNNFN
jgi:hypothetical protein